jgi:exodeoxyribonuclease VII small subunit
VTGPGEPDSGDEALQDGSETSFERALEELEAAVERLEEGTLTLEEQVAFYERGMKLVNACREKLDGAAARIEKVVGSAEGETAVEPFERPGQNDQASR